MNRLQTKRNSLKLRKGRIRKSIVGSSGRPRLTVSVTNLHVSAQIIDDEKHTTIAHVTTVGNKKLDANLTKRAEWVGTEIAKKAKLNKIKKVAFDRNGKLYHGRTKAIADAARKGGMEF
jgi:large subunit ribosomal protein L18